MNKWQDITDMEVCKGTLNRALLIEYRLIRQQNHLICYQNIAGRSSKGKCHLFPPLLTPFSEFLIHAADVEGLCQGIDEQLVTSMSRSVMS